MLDSDWGVGGGGKYCDLSQSQFFICMHIFYILSLYIVSLTVHFLCICISSSKITYTKHEKYFKGLVIFLITWCPPIGWCPRALAQSRLWIIRPCMTSLRAHRSVRTELQFRNTSGLRREKLCTVTIIFICVLHAAECYSISVSFILRR